MNAEYLRKNGTVLVSATGPIRVVFRNAPPFTGELDELAAYVREHQARFSRGSTHNGKDASFLPRFTPTNAAQRAFLAAKIEAEVAKGDFYTFGSIEAANQFAKELTKCGIPWTKKHFGWAINEHTV